VNHLFAENNKLPHRQGDYSREEVQLANRNSGIALELLTHDVTPPGMHYLLNHFDIPVLDEATWTLPITGLVNTPLSLPLHRLQQFPKFLKTVTMECAGNGRAGFEHRKPSMPWQVEAVGTAAWTGARLMDVLEEAGVQEKAVEVVFTGADRGFDAGVDHHFARSLSREQAHDQDVLLAYEMNDQPLPIQHGAPLRVIVPGWFGMGNVKWLTSIEAIDRPFEGHQQAANYHYKTTPDDPGIPVTHLRVKSLMAPPGVPDWYTRRRFVEPGQVRLTGRAWSGNGVPVEKVEVGIDGKWHPTQIRRHESRYAWSQWNFEWEAEPGEHLLSCCATDAEGNMQPDAPVWDQSGFGNNSIHTLQVTVGNRKSEIANA